MWTSRLSLASRRVSVLVAARLPTAQPIIRSISTIYDSSSVTYSGGQATEGQGGFYGSGGARKIMDIEPHRPELLALASDVQAVLSVMEEVDTLEQLLREEKDLNKSMEARTHLKKLMTCPEFLACLERLECVKGEPVWGLNQEERELIVMARNKVNAC